MASGVGQPNRILAHPVSPWVFHIVVTVLTALAWAVTWLSARSGAQTFWTYVMFGYVVGVLANAIYPHLALSISRRDYMPGTATAVALNLPLQSFLAVCLREAKR